MAEVLGVVDLLGVAEVEEVLLHVPGLQQHQDGSASTMSPTTLYLISSPCEIQGHESCHPEILLLSTTFFYCSHWQQSDPCYRTRGSMVNVSWRV